MTWSMTAAWSPRNEPKPKTRRRMSSGASAIGSSGGEAAWIGVAVPGERRRAALIVGEQRGDAGPCRRRPALGKRRRAAAGIGVDAVAMQDARDAGADRRRLAVE